jgi:hypothetical protein
MLAGGGCCKEERSKCINAQCSWLRCRHSHRKRQKPRQWRSPLPCEPRATHRRRALSPVRTRVRDDPRVRDESICVCVCERERGGLWRHAVVPAASASAGMLQGYISGSARELIRAPEAATHRQRTRYRHNHPDTPAAPSPHIRETRPSSAWRGSGWGWHPIVVPAALVCVWGSMSSSHAGISRRDCAKHAVQAPLFERKTTTRVHPPSTQGGRPHVWGEAVAGPRRLPVSGACSAVGVYRAACGACSTTTRVYVGLCGQSVDSVGLCSCSAVGEYTPCARVYTRCVLEPEPRAHRMMYGWSTE